MAFLAAAFASASSTFNRLGGPGVGGRKRDEERAATSPPTDTTSGHNNPLSRDSPLRPATQTNPPTRLPSEAT